jgi:hypothetical protein
MAWGLLHLSRVDIACYPRIMPGLEVNSSTAIIIEVSFETFSTKVLPGDGDSCVPPG